MICPICFSRTKVTHTLKKAAPVRRRRKCERCNHAFQTTEFVSLPASLKVKKSGERGLEFFARQKLIDTIEWLAKSHDLKPRVREEILQEIEYHLLALVDRDVVSARLLAELLFKSLHQRSPDAAKLFGSSYLDADGQPAFKQEERVFPQEPRSAITLNQLSLFDN